MITNQFRAATFTVAAFLFCVSVGAQTNISISNTALQTGVKRIGLNLGGPVVPYGSQQLMKNLIGTNPGFNNSIVSSTVPCDQAATATTCQTGESQNYTSGWWGSYTATMRVMTGSAAGCTSTITNFVPNTFTWSGFSGNSPVTGSACSTFAQSGTPSVTNYIQVTKTITASNSGSSYNPTWGWVTTSTGSSPTYTTVSDAPASPDSESIYSQSLQMSATGSDVAQIGVTADASSSIIAGRNFVNMNGTYTVSFWGKSVSGTSPAVTISVSRGSTSYYVHTFPMTGSWTQYTGTFTPAETGTQSGYINFSASVTGATVEVDNFSLVEPTTSGNPTNFRDAVVSALQALKPGVIRMWDGISETNTLDNMLVNQFARAPANFRSYSINGYPGYYNYISYSIPDTLQLCQTVGSECWITIPVTFTPTDVSNLIDYLSGDGTTTYGARRISQGQTTPWTSVTAIPKIYLELGNEQWNNGFTGGDMAYNPPAYGTLAQQLFSTMKAKSDYVSAKMSLVLGAQFQGTYYIQGIQNQISSNDMIDVAPYLMNNVTDGSSPNLWNSTLAEPQLLYSAVGTAVCMENNNYSYAQNSYTGPITACPTEASYSITGSSGSVVHNYGGGIMAQNFQAEANSSHSVPFAFYEMSVDGSGSEPSGGLTQSQLNGYLPSLGVGLMNANSSLEGMANGVFVQNVFQLGQDYYQLSGINYLMWGIVEDMGGPTNGKRPTFSAVQLANSAISPGGSMLTVTQTGTPTYTLGTPSAAATYANDGAVNSVAGNNIQGIRSFAFSGSNGYGLVMFNNTASSQAVTFSGAAAPAGTVTINTLTSANPSDNNETTTTTVVPVTTTATSPTGYTLPAYSEVVMTWSAGYTCTNTSADAAAIQSLVNSGGTVTLIGNCDITSVITVTNAVTIQGATAPTTGTAGAPSGNATLTGSVADIFSISSNNVTITGLNFSGTTAAVVNEITAGTPNQYFTFTYNSVSNTNSNDGLDLGPIMQYATINYDKFSYIAPNNFATSGTYGSDISGSVGISGLNGWDQSTINYNKFDLTGMDAIHIAWNEVILQRYYFLTQNVSVSYNTFSRVHRMAIEAQGTTNSYVQCTSPGVPSNCTSTSLLLSTGWKVAGNYTSSFFQAYYWTYGYSLVTGNNGEIVNNTAAYNTWSGIGSSCVAVAQETAGNTILNQGNVYSSDNGGPANCSSYNTLSGWSSIIYVLGAEGTAGGSTELTVQNNYACSAGLSSTMIENETNGALLPRTEQYNYVASTCPHAGSLTTSSMSPSYISSSTTSGTTTFNFGVSSTLSIQGVSFAVDGGAPISTQEVSDLSTTFATDQKWLYHTSLSESSYSSGTHTVTMTATDVSGATSTASTTFTNGSSGPATYYVSNTGSDSNAGTSSSAPWQTIAKVNAATLVAGSSVLFQAGGLWREMLTLSSSGTSGNPITIGSYGSGARPVIDGANYVSWTNVSGNVWSTPKSTLTMPNFSGTAGVLVASQAAVTAANDYYCDGSATCYVYSTSNPASTVEMPTRNYGINVNGQSYITISGIEVRGAQLYGIEAQSTTAFSNLIINGNLADLNFSNGINILTTVSGQTASTITLSGNTAQYNGSSGIKIGQYWSAVTVSGNTANYNCQAPSSSSSFDNQFCGGIYGYGADGTAGSSTWSGNTTNYNGVGVIGACGDSSIGQGIWSDTTTSVALTGNTANGNTANGCYLEKTVTGVAYENLCINNATGTFTGNLVVAAGQSHNSSGNYIFNNTAGGTGYSAMQMNFEDSTASMSSNQIRNNIFFMTGPGGSGGNIAFLASAQVNDGTHGSGNVLHYNSFGTSYTDQFYAESTFYSSYASFETAWCGVTNCTISLTADPEFVAPGSGNYNLQSGSPARNFGTAYSSAYEPCGIGSVDLGAFPYTCSSGSSFTITASSNKITAGGTVTLSTSPSETVNWVITSQSGALLGHASLGSSSGPTNTLSLASGTYYAGQPIVVTATVGSYTASATIYSSGGAFLIPAHR